MIWDRFDDAHDDYLKDIRHSENEIEVLQGKLRTARISYKEYKKPESNNEPGPQGWYEDTQSEDSSLSAYKGYLQKLLVDSSSA
jgi:hypothetical protein